MKNKYYNIRTTILLRGFVIVLLLIKMLFSPLNAEPTKYRFTSITNKNGLSHNTVYDICQDQKGFMWFATDEGLNRFDGQKIRQYFSEGKESTIPSNSVRKLLFTPKNDLFIGTDNGLALYHPETDDFSRYYFENKPLGKIIDLQYGHEDELLISTSDNGAFIFDYENNSITPVQFNDQRIFGILIDKNGNYWAYTRFDLFKFNDQLEVLDQYNFNLFQNSAISHVYSDRRGVLWVGTFEAGLYTFNFESKQFIPFIASNNVELFFIRTIKEGENPNEYWIGTEKGLYILNVQSGFFQHYVQSFNDKLNPINDNAVYKIYRNKQNVYFVGTYFGGVNMTKTRQTGFQAIYPMDGEGFLNGKALSSIARAPDGKLWIATEDAGIAIYDEKLNRFQHIVADEDDTNTIATNNVHALLMDDKVCWAGHFMGGLSRINLKTFDVERFRTPQNNTIHNNFVFALHFISDDSIMIGTMNGADIYSKSRDEFSIFRQNELADCFIYEIFTAPDGKVWLCTYNNGIFVYDRNSQDLMRHYSSGDNSGLPGNSIISYCIDFEERVWIGTRGDGLCYYDPGSDLFISYGEELLPNKVIYGILEDDDRNLWISTNSGISKLNHIDSTITNYNYKHGLSSNQFNYKSYFKGSSGTMYFGSVNGLNWFDPGEIKIPSDIPQVYFSNFYIFNEEILPDATDVMNQQIDYIDTIKLAHHQHSFTIGFASINFKEANIGYQYYLEGQDESWLPLTENTLANYTNISPGEYVFHLRARNKIAKQTSPERNLTIIIPKPIWATLYAFFVYALIVTFVIYLIYRNYKNIQHEKMALTIEKMEKENLKVLHQHKMNFFTFISHEFKTPLSIIVASIDIISQNTHNFNKEINELHQTIKRSANRLLFLVSQLMEFRKIETDHTVLSIKKGKILDFINQIINLYNPLIDKKKIDLKVQMNAAYSELIYDFDKLEKILTNLLSNAIKYTPEGGKVSFKFNASDDYIYFSVSDNGSGLSESQKKRIFEVFYSDDFSKDVVESSGVGLALTAGLVKFLNGEIKVESELGKGSEFIVKLPVNKIETEAIPIHTTIKKKEIDEIDEIFRDEEMVTSNPYNDYEIVVVEDNKDLLNLLQKNFKQKYKVKGFENGESALEYIRNNLPDLVITDIMMPNMTGTELCNRIKSDVNLWHIPVIILTAKNNPESKIEGFKLGADAYILKPFSIEELDLRISNIFKTRNILKKRFEEIAKLEGITIPHKNHDQAFIEKLMDFIQENIDNGALDIQFIAGQLKISRSHLHNKVKAVLNMNTSEFINTIRINYAKQLILESELTFSEIAFKIGYNDVAYFNRVFKKITSKTPGEFRKVNGV